MGSIGSCLAPLKHYDAHAILLESPSRWTTVTYPESLPWDGAIMRVSETHACPNFSALTMVCTCPSLHMLHVVGRQVPTVIRACSDLGTCAPHGPDTSLMTPVCLTRLRPTRAVQVGGDLGLPCYHKTVKLADVAEGSMQPVALLGYPQCVERGALAHHLENGSLQSNNQPCTFGDLGSSSHDPLHGSHSLLTKHGD